MVAVALVSSSITYIFAQSSLSIQYISGGLYPGAPTYTIWKEGSMYYAKNEYGKIDYGGTNASQIFANCIDVLPNGGTLFLVSPTKFYLDVPLMLKRNIALHGETSTHTYIPYGTPEILPITLERSLTSSNAGPVIDTDSTTYNGEISIENVAVMCNGIATIGIRLYNAFRPILRNIDIVVGYNVNPSVGLCLYAEAYNNVFGQYEQVHIWQAKTAVYLSGKGTNPSDPRVTLNTFIGLTTTDCDQGIDFHKACDTNSFYNTIILSNRYMANGCLFNTYSFDANAEVYQQWFYGLTVDLNNASYGYHVLVQYSHGNGIIGFRGHASALGYAGWHISLTQGIHSQLYYILDTGTMRTNGGTVYVGAGNSSIAITLNTEEPDAYYGILVTPSWNTTFWTTDGTATGFTVHFGTSPAGDGIVSWMIIRGDVYWYVP